MLGFPRFKSQNARGSAGELLAPSASARTQGFGWSPMHLPKSLRQGLNSACLFNQSCISQSAPIILDHYVKMLVLLCASATSTWLDFVMTVLTFGPAAV
jgi:hypothetical protein